MVDLPSTSASPAGPDAIWAVGDNGTVLRRTNGLWKRVEGPGTNELWKVHQTAPDEVWVLGADGAFHWKDGRWHQRSDAVLRSIWSRGPNEVWMAGSGVWRWDGKRFDYVHTGQFVGGLGGQGPILSDDGVIHRWTGNAFRSWFLSHGDLSKILDIAGPSLDDMWLLTGRPDHSYGTANTFTLSHWDGFKQTFVWNQMDRTDSHAQGWPKYHALVHVEGDRVLLFGEHGGVFTHTHEGTEPRPLKHPAYVSLAITGLKGVWTVHPTYPDTYALRRWDGSSGHFTERFPQWLYSARAVSGISSDDLWALAPEGIASLHDSTLAHGGWYQAFSNVREGELWAVGIQGHAARWKDGSWESLPTGTTAAFQTAWIAAPDDVWLGGDTLLHWDGATFHVPRGIDPESKMEIVSIAGSAPDDVWALASPWPGGGAALRRWNGIEWAVVDLPEANRWCQSIWVSEDRDVFLSCYEGFYRHTSLGWRKLPVERPPSKIAGPPGLGIAAVGNALMRFCRE